MGITPELFSAVWLWLTNVALLGVIVSAVRRADWDQVAVERLFQHSFFASVLLLFLLWQLRAGLAPGLTIHLLGMTAVTLMLGWALAVLAGLLALLLTILVGHEILSTFGITGLVTVVIPVLVSYAVMLWERSRGFRLFFAYLFFCGFFGAALAFAGSGVLMVLLLWLADVYSWRELVHEYLRYLPLMMLPEAFVNGVVVTGLMIFHPQRLITLDESRYL